MGWTLALWVIFQVAGPGATRGLLRERNGAALVASSQAEVIASRDELRRARNEYAFGNYETAAEQLRALLEPLRLTDCAQIVQARELLALAYYLTDQLPKAREEFKRLLDVAPDFELDPYTVAPPIIDIFESLRGDLHPEAAQDKAAHASDGGASVQGVLRTIEYRSTQRSAFATYLPFGVGQFQNGELALGTVFAATQAAFLAANIGCYLAASSMHGYTHEQASTLRALTVVQYTTLGLFGLSWGVGAFQARLHFVPVILETPRVQETPLYGSAR